MKMPFLLIGISPDYAKNGPYFYTNNVDGNWPIVWRAGGKVIYRDEKWDFFAR